MMQKRLAAYIVFVLFVLFQLCGCMHAKDPSTSDHTTESSTDEQTELSTKEYKDYERFVSKQVRENGGLFFEDYVYNDDISLEDGISKKYDLAELNEFFQGRGFNEILTTDPENEGLFFVEVNQNFPTEVIRTQNYSVYGVLQGGYYYVFWEDTPLPEGPIVYFSAYISGNKNTLIFNSLTPGVSTAVDAKKIDPYLEMNHYSGSGIYSHSYVDHEISVCISYKHPENIPGKKWDYDDYVVENICVEDRRFASRYALILEKDLR